MILAFINGPAFIVEDQMVSHQRFKLIRLITDLAVDFDRLVIVDGSVLFRRECDDVPFIADARSRTMNEMVELDRGQGSTADAPAMLPCHY